MPNVTRPKFHCYSPIFLYTNVLQVQQILYYYYIDSKNLPPSEFLPLIF